MGATSIVEMAGVSIKVGADSVVGVAAEEAVKEEMEVTVGVEGDSGAGVGVEGEDSIVAVVMIFKGARFSSA